MGRSSDEWWSINDVSLHQYGWSVATVGGSRYNLPPKRGENIKLAGRPGTMHRPKLADSRTVTLVMWLTGAVPGVDPLDDPLGAMSDDPTLQWNDSWDFLRRAVWQPNGEQVDLTRRWFLTVNGVKTLVTATAKAEIADTMDPTMTGRTRADFAMTLLLADPFYYGTQQVQQVDISKDVGTPEEPAVDNTVTVFNPGHDYAGFGFGGGLEVDFVCDADSGVKLKNPRLTNLSLSPDVWLQYKGEISQGVTIRHNIEDFLAYQVSNNNNYIFNVAHGGAKPWMLLGPGDNALKLTAEAGEGHAVVRFRPPYV